MPGLVSDATRIWELNLYWPLHAQCGVWDPKGKGVDVWECVRARTYLSYSLLSQKLIAQLPQTNRRQALKYVLS